MLTEEEKNNIRAYALFRNFISETEPKILVAFDFDEFNRGKTEAELTKKGKTKSRTKYGY